MRNHEIEQKLQPYAYETFANLAGVTGHHLRGMSSQIGVITLVFSRVIDRLGLDVNFERIQAWSQSMNAIHDYAKHICYQSGVVCYSHMNDGDEITSNKRDHWQPYDTDAWDKLVQQLEDTLMPAITSIDDMVSSLEIPETWSAIQAINDQTLESIASHTITEIKDYLARLRSHITYISLDPDFEQKREKSPENT